MDRSPVLELEGFLPYRLTALAGQVSKRLAAVYEARFGITPAQWRVIAHLAADGPSSVRDIHQAATLDKAKVSRASARLEAMGYVAKGVDPRDRRLIALRLTRKGWACYRAIEPLALEFERDWTRSLSWDERATLDRILVKLARG